MGDGMAGCEAGRNPVDRFQSAADDDR